MKCKTKGCRKESTIIYYGVPMCDDCWMKESEDADRN